MSCRNCGGHRDCSRCNRCNNEPDTIVDRDVLRNDFGFGVTVDGNYTADPDDKVINVLAAAGTTPVITLADPDDAGPYGSVTIVSKLTPVTVTNLNGDGTGSATVAAGTGSVFFTLGTADPCTDTGAVWVAQAISTPVP